MGKAASSITAAWLVPAGAGAAKAGRSTSSLSEWSVCAEQRTVDETFDGDGSKIDLEECFGKTALSSKGYSLDLSSPREWLEYWEEQCNGQPGAYTVLRCDYQCRSDDNDPWVIWGQEFHLQRLQDSWQCLGGGTIPSDDIMKEEYKLETKFLLQALLSEAETKLAQLCLKGKEKEFQKGTIVTVMLSILWQKRPEINSGNIQPLIKGHICSSCTPSQPLQYDPEPISAVLALERPNAIWPSRRIFHPEAKLSSWCRQRRPLEEGLKKSGVGEVLLVKTGKDEGNNDDIEILEGLISNVFFVYPGGILRTAHQDVLDGYARELIMNVAHQCGLTLDTLEPVSIYHCDQWEEVWTTSSIRLVAPVKEILVPRYENGSREEVASFQQIWSKETASSKKENADQLPYWRRLFRRVLADQYI
jgi:hypothetical protein